MPRNLRLAASLLLLALPLAIAAWAFSNYAASRERTRADELLARDVRAAVGAYRSVLGEADQRGRRYARKRRVQRALAHHERAYLARLTAATPTIGFALDGSSAPRRSGTVNRTVDVVARGRTIGRVVAYVRLNTRLLSRLRQDAEVSGRETLAFAEGENIQIGTRAGRVPAAHPLNRAFDFDLAGRRYRAASASLLGPPHSLALLATEPASVITARADRARWRVALVATGLIAAILVIAYTLAPGIARTRVARQQRDQAARVLAHIGDGIFLLDTAGVVQVWNTAAEAITGLRAEKVIGRRAVEAIPGWAAIEKRVPIAALPSEPERTPRAEALPLDVDGNELWLSLVGVSFADGVVYAFRDVTSEHRLEEIRSEFVATISHELRTPLASLHGAALTLLEHHERLTGETQHALYDVIADQSRRLASLVDEILLAGQLDAGGLKVVNEPFDAEELVRSAVEAARLRGDGARIETSMAPVLPRVAGDPGRTRQVLVNLIDNAIKYARPGGRIQVRVEADDERVRFAVSDEGVGIPPSEQERIFEKFYRLDPDQRHGIGGTGLGLYICRELLRSMGGRIWVESTPGEGATFSFDLPVADRELVPA
jgi:PAS domain S-box-containing protein